MQTCSKTLKKEQNIEQDPSGRVQEGFTLVARQNLIASRANRPQAEPNLQVELGHAPKDVLRANEDHW